MHIYGSLFIIFLAIGIWFLLNDEIPVDPPVPVMLQVEEAFPVPPHFPLSTDQKLAFERLQDEYRPKLQHLLSETDALQREL
ncbi:MAG TPA: hypothetical protein PKD72_10065, partial [Gemmatales bacterium]|nr:hypothetical protein [Gemmatales bacterium]